MSSTSGAETASYAYTSDGKLDGGTWSGTNYDFIYDPFDNLKTVNKSGDLVDFGYDGDGLRVTKSITGRAIVYHYDQAGKMISENDGNDNFIFDYVYLYGKLVAKVVKYPYAPSNLTASVQSLTSVQLDWTDNSGGKTDFKIERKVGIDGTYEVIATVPISLTSYLDSGVTTGSTYYYRVNAFSTTSEAGYSNEAQATLKQYTIKASAGVNGIISPSGDITVFHGKDQSFSFTPVGGYHVAQVLVDGASVGAMTWYNFTNVSVDHTVTVFFELDIPNISVSPTSYNFGSIDGGLSSSKYFIISNTGTGSLTINSATISGTNAGEFSVKADNCSGKALTPSSTCSIQIAFSPTSIGSKSASLSISSNDPDQPSTAVPLSGIGTGTQFTVTIEKEGAGTVTSIPSGINCGSICSTSFSKGTTVMLTALPYQGYAFVGRSGVVGGACSGTGECTLTINENKTITAIFSPLAQPLDLAFVIDSTGSMWDDIDKVKASAMEIVNKIGAEVSDFRIAVVDYKDHPVSPYGGSSDYPYRAVLPFSKDKTAIVSAINSLSASGGADWPESVYSGLINTINAVNLGAWRPEAQKVIILMGDAPPHDPEPVTGYTLNAVIEAAYSIATPSALFRPGAMLASSLNPLETYSDAISAEPVAIYSVVVGSDTDALESFTKLSEGTEGKVFTAATAEDVVSEVMEVIDEVTTPRNRPPLCSSATADIQQLWPPDHKMRNINVTNVNDPDGDPVNITITGITQDEPVKAQGSGNTSLDGEGVGAGTAQVRAERTGKENGRVYKISFTASDGKDGRCSGYVLTCVPHDQGENVVCVDDGQLYDSTVLDTEQKKILIESDCCEKGSSDCNTKGKRPCEIKGRGSLDKM